MRYFRNPQNQEVFGYDVDGSQDNLIENAINAGWEEITGGWPPPPDFISMCKETAKYKINMCDWSVLPDVHLSNKEEFIVYRATLRALILNPVADPVFPTEPQPVWE